MAFTSEELLENNLMKPVVPPVDPNEGLVQLAMAKGKGKVPFMKDPARKPDPILELDLDIPLQLEKGKSLEEMQSERLNLKTETDVLKDKFVIDPKESRDYKKIDKKIKHNTDVIADLDKRIQAIHNAKSSDIMEGSIDFSVDNPVMKWAIPDAIRSMREDRFTVGQLLNALKEKVSRTELDETSFENALKNPVYLKENFAFDKGTMLDQPVKGMDLQMIKDTDPNTGKVISTIFQVKADNRKFDQNTVISKEQALSIFHDVAPKIHAHLFSTEPLRTAINDFNNFLTKTKYSDTPGGGRRENLANRPTTREGEELRVMLAEDVRGLSEQIEFEAVKIGPEGKEVEVGKIDADVKSMAAGNLNAFFNKHHGIKDVMEEGIPIYSTEIPAYIKKMGTIWRDILQGRGVNYITEGKPSHGEAQFLKGGANHNELVFSYTPGSLRKNEPTYENTHKFDITPDNVFVWTRFTDRYDTRNRKLLFIEEIQSDMHQGARKAMKKEKAKEPVYAIRGDEPTAKTQKLQNELSALLTELRNIDPTNQARREELRVEIKSMKKKVKAAGMSSKTPEGPFKKSENYANFAIKNVLRYALDNGYDGVALISGKAKNKANNNSPGSVQYKGTLGAYNNIYASTMKDIANDKNLYFPENGVIIKDGEGVAWPRLPAILFDDAAVKKIKGETFKTYKSEGGFVLKPLRHMMKDVVPTL